MIPFELSELPHTWFIDLDGTVLDHNAHLRGEDRLLPGVVELWNTIPKNDCIIITTGRSEQYRKSTLDLLQDSGLRYNFALFELPLGERIIINDTKPAGLKTAIAWNVERNKGFL
jgi:hydroxymethylpyrimidine pyrophosphatase-like HAD family hydrolase